MTCGAATRRRDKGIAASLTELCHGEPVGPLFKEIPSCFSMPTAYSSFAPWLRDDAARVDDLGRFAPAVRRVFTAVCERPPLKITEASRRRGISLPTASKGMDSLLALGVLRELTGRRRNRVFAYDRHPAILSGGTEPL